MAEQGVLGHIPKKVAEYEAFLYRLKADLQAVINQRQLLQQQMDAYRDLASNLKRMQEDGQKEMRSLVNLGAEVFCQAEVHDTSRVFVDVGLGFHVEFTQTEGMEFSKVKIASLQGKAKEYDKQAASIKANLKLVGEGIAELMQLPAANALPKAGGFHGRG